MSCPSSPFGALSQPLETEGGRANRPFLPAMNSQSSRLHSQIAGFFNSALSEPFASVTAACHETYFFQRGFLGSIAPSHRQAFFCFPGFHPYLPLLLAPFSAPSKAGTDSIFFFRLFERQSPFTLLPSGPPVSGSNQIPPYLTRKGRQ